MRLNEITTLVEDKSNLTSENESLIKQVFKEINENGERYDVCLLYTSPSPRDRTRSRMPSSA